MCLCECASVFASICGRVGIDGWRDRERQREIEGAIEILLSFETVTSVFHGKIGNLELKLHLAYD